MSRSRYKAGDGSVERARELRRDATPAELKLWSVVRNRALDGFKFRKQQRLGPFYADFVCQEVRLIVEVDGETHGTPEAERADARRTAYLEREGYRVVRFTNDDVLTNIEGVAATISAALAASLAPSPSHSASPSGPLPLPQGERG